MSKLVTFALCTVAIASSFGAPTTSPLFCIPDVHIEVFQPKGFRVSIPHEDGLQMFAFHASINKQMKNYEVGQYFKDVMYPVNGRWVYEEMSAKLKRGDTLYFWVYVLHNKLGYRKDDQMYKVTELITYPFPGENIFAPPRAPDVSDLQGIPEAAPSESIDNSQYQTCATNLTTCERIVLKITHKLVEIDNGIETLKKTNSLLKNIIERQPDGRKLTMSGRISREDNPINVVKFILNEKLNLSPMILSAVRNSDLSITFELSNVDELVAIISEAKSKLNNSKVITISY